MFSEVVSPSGGSPQTIEGAGNFEMYLGNHFPCNFDSDTQSLRHECTTNMVKKCLCSPGCIPLNRTVYLSSVDEVLYGMWTLAEFFMCLCFLHEWGIHKVLEKADVIAEQPLSHLVESSGSFSKNLCQRTSSYAHSSIQYGTMHLKHTVLQYLIRVYGIFMKSKKWW